MSIFYLVFLIAYLAILDVCLIIHLVNPYAIAKVGNFIINLRVYFHYTISHNKQR